MAKNDYNIIMPYGKTKGGKRILIDTGSKKTAKRVAQKARISNYKAIITKRKVGYRIYTYKQKKKNLW